MDLKLCPSCGQSVLDDEATLCPFCGSAMDGSDKGARKPPGTKSGAGKPGASKSGAASSQSSSGTRGTRAEKPKSAASADDSSVGTGASAAKPASKAGPRGGKPQVDEDDPFGLSNLNPVADVIQVLSKPEKGHLHKVVCPMCEKPGFVAKSAIGKQVRCANEKCMIPVFTVPDPNAPKAERLPRRRATSDDSAGGEEAGSAKPRSPLLIYGVSGVVLLVMAVGLVQILNRGPSVPANLSSPVDVPPGGYGTDTEDPDALAKAEAARKAAASAVKNPAAEAERLIKRMIQIARLNSNRDKAYARRLTGDLYLRLNQPTLAAQEFAQMLLVNRQAGYYQIEPRLRIYWNHRKTGNAAAAKADLAQLLKDAETIPGSGRIALEAVMGVSSVLIVEGRQDQAAELIRNHQRDATIVLNRDAMSSAAWFFCMSSLTAGSKPAIAVTDVFAWKDPLRTAVTLDVAVHASSTRAIAWAKTGSSKLDIADSLAVIAEVSAGSGVSEAELSAIEAAAAAVDPMSALRVRSIIAAEQKSKQRLQALAEVVSTIQPGQALKIPAIDQVLRMELPDGSSQRLRAAALTDYARAAVLCGDMTAAEGAVRKLTGTMFEIAPATADTRRAVLEVEQRDGDVKRRITAEMRITRDTEVASTFRNYRRKIDQFAVAAEERRLGLIQKLARIVRVGGEDAIRAVLNDTSAGLKQEILVDELAGLLAAAATRTGNVIPEIERLDPALVVPLPDRTKELHEIAVGPLLVRAWRLSKQGNLPVAMKTISAGSNDLPGLREAILNEIIRYIAAKAEKPADVYTGIGQIANYPVWREEALQAAGRIFAARGLEADAEKWVESQSRMPSTEQVTALYGIAVGLIARAGEEAAAADRKPAESNR